MARLTFDHSEDWIDKLLTIQELSPTESKAVLAHVASCATCGHILNEYDALREQVRLYLHQSVTGMPPGLPPRLLELWREEDARRQVQQQQEEERISSQENERHNFVYEVVSRFKRSR